LKILANTAQGAPSTAVTMVTTLAATDRPSDVEDLTAQTNTDVATCECVCDVTLYRTADKKPSTSTHWKPSARVKFILQSNQK
jgi:hypothetical protein